MTYQSKRFMIIMLTTVILLMIPFIAMQFTSEVNWSLFDFVVAAGLLTATGFACEIVMRKVKKTKYRIAVCATILALLLLLWIELAVGIFGTPLAGN
jgi:Kef-type K+ transport system membrane component KefB